MRVLVALLAFTTLFAAETFSQTNPLRIMPLGDSTTQAQGGVSESQPGFASYRYWLWKALENESYPVDFVGSQHGVWNGDSPHTDYDQDHEGHWGWRADEILAEVGPWAEASRPDVVLIHLGHNDLWQGESISSTINELDQIIDTVRVVNPEAIFLLAQVIPSAFAVLDSLAPFNEQIPGLAAAKHSAQSPVLVVDQCSGFDPWLHTYDGVHPNEVGEQIMAGQWLAPLQSIVAGLSGVWQPAKPNDHQLRLSNFPNPFNPATAVRFDLATAATVNLTIFDLSGRKVRTLKVEAMPAGRHEVFWRGKNDQGSQVSAGVYLCQLKAGSLVETIRMTLVK